MLIIMIVKFQKNLASYPEDGPPVVVDYYPSSSNKNPESTSVNDMDEEEGTSEGPCSFVVHGLTGEEFSTKTMKTIKTIALQHLTSEKKILAIGHSETPESIYANPQLFPSMLPWLFPYGLGGIGQTEHKYNLSSMMHKRHLLMYYDKRFQKDPHFPLIAFNHEQMKESTRGVEDLRSGWYAPIRSGGPQTLAGEGSLWATIFIDSVPKPYD